MWALLVCVDMAIVLSRPVMVFDGRFLENIATSQGSVVLGPPKGSEFRFREMGPGKLPAFLDAEISDAGCESCGVYFKN